MADLMLFRHALDLVLPISTSRGSRVHGEAHWRRVATHGLAICEQTVGADALVAALFGLFHDSMRVNDSIDPGHGRRGGDLARRLNGSLGIDQAQLDVLVAACNDHTKGMTSTDPTIGACWDADRLDLVRLRFAIDWKKMSTEAACDKEAVGRAVALLSVAPSWDEIERRLEELLEKSRPETPRYSPGH